MPKPLALYIHFPFCRQKCRYCDFLSFVPENGAVLDSYTDALMSEILTVPRPLFDSGQYFITSIFIGGGTPSLIPPSKLSKLFEALGRYPFSPDIEITIESNPGTLNASILSAMKACGINRLSIGLQSANDSELKALGRIHTYRQFEENFYMAREAGFNNINIDLMSALPGQTAESYEATVRRVLSLSPEHISAYSLILEEGTPFYTYYEENQNTGFFLPPLPQEDTERDMYHLTKKLLKEFGYERYEISNYARPGFICRHNLAYWTRRDYLGLGLGAASMIDNTRFSNTDDLKVYMDSFAPMADKVYAQYSQTEILKNRPARGRGIFAGSLCLNGAHQRPQKLSVHEQMEEFMFLGLRLTDGISKKEFSDAFGQDINQVYGPVINKHLKDKTMACTKDGRLRLTERGFDVSNYIMSDFLFD